MGDTKLDAKKAEELLSKLEQLEIGEKISQTFSNAARDFNIKIETKPLGSSLNKKAAALTAHLEGLRYFLTTTYELNPAVFKQACHGVIKRIPAKENQ